MQTQSDITIIEETKVESDDKHQESIDFINSEEFVELDCEDSINPNDFSSEQYNGINGAPNVDTRYKSGDLRWFFKNIFRPYNLCTDETGLEKVDFYFSEKAVILTPASDKIGEKNPISLTETLFNLQENQAFKSQLDEKRILIIPIAQMQLTPMQYERNHWVTLHCNLQDQENPVITLIDSRPWFLSFLYPTRFIFQQIQESLRYFGYQISNENFHVKHQAVQYDDVHCGACTFYNIKSLANLPPQNLDTYCNSLKYNAMQNILNYNKYVKTLIEQSTNNRPVILSDQSPLSDSYQYIENNELSQSWAEINEEDLTEHANGIRIKIDEDDWAILNLNFFTDVVKQNWIETALKGFHECFLDDEAMLQAIIKRESLKFDGVKIKATAFDFQDVDLQRIVNDLERNYPTKQNLSDNVSGFGIFDLGRVGNMLRRIGVSEEEIEGLTLIDIIKFDTALFTAEGMAGHLEAMIDINQQHDGENTEETKTFNENVLEAIPAEINTFLENLYTKLQQAFYEQRHKIIDEISGDFRALEPTPAALDVSVNSDNSNNSDTTELVINVDEVEDEVLSSVERPLSPDSHLIDIDNGADALVCNVGEVKDEVLSSVERPLSPDSHLTNIEHVIDTDNTPANYFDEENFTDFPFFTDIEETPIPTTTDSINIESTILNADTAINSNDDNTIDDEALNSFIFNLKDHFYGNKKEHIDGTNSSGIREIFKMIDSTKFKTANLESKIDILRETMQNISNERVNGCCGFRSLLSNFTFFGLTRGRSEKAHALYSYCSEWSNDDISFSQFGKGHLDGLIEKLNEVNIDSQNSSPAL